MKNILNTILFIFLFASISYSQSKEVIGLGSGFSKAIGNDSEIWNPGYTLNIEWFHEISNDYWIGCQGIYNKWNFDINEEPILQALSENFSMPLRIIEIVPTIRFFSPSKKYAYTSFFGQIGIGYYLIDLKGEFKTYNSNKLNSLTIKKENKFGVNFGTGVVISNNNKVKVSIAPMFKVIFTEKDFIKYFSTDLILLFRN